MRSVRDGDIWKCGDCGSAALYRDDDEITGARCIACKICGGRDYGPVKINEIHIEREAIMLKKECRNCGRTKAIVADGLCWVCRKASDGLTGAQKEKALAEAKVKIESGKIRTWGKGTRSSAPAGGSLQPVRTGAELQPIQGMTELIADPSGTVVPITIRLNIEVGISVV